MILWTLVALPLTAGGLLALAGRRADRVGWLVSMAASAVTLLLAVAVAAGRPSVSAPWLAGLPAGLAVDGLSAVLVLTVGTVALVVVGYSGEGYGARFHGLVLLFVGAMLVTVTATSLGVLLVGWELMGAMSYALIGYRWSALSAVGAGRTAFLTTRAADLGLYLACAAAVAGAGTLQIDALTGVPGGWRDAVVAGVVLAALGKSAQLPFSFWLCRAMEGPSPVSALLHSATMVAAGAYLLLRTVYLLAVEPWAGVLVAWVGVGTALVLGLVALAQTDLKQLLAASTCAQLGFLVLAAGVAAPAAGSAHLVAHAATKALLFLAAGALLHALGTRELGRLAGAGRTFPVVGAVVAVGALSLACAPPLSLWLTKDGVLAAALTANPLLYAVGLLAGGVSALYAGKALVLVLRPPGLPRAISPLMTSGGTPAPATSPLMARPVSVPQRMRVAMVVLAVAVLLLGVVLPPVRAATGGPVTPPGGAELAVSAALALACLLGVGWWIERGAGVPVALRRPFACWLHLEPLAHRTVVRPVLALARVLDAVDGRVNRAAPRTVSVDAMVEAVASLGRRGADRTRHADDRGVDRAVSVVAAATAWLGRQARRPQTGQVHQYYAQAVVGFAALVVLLLVVLG